MAIVVMNPASDINPKHLMILSHKLNNISIRQQLRSAPPHRASWAKWGRQKACSAVMARRSCNSTCSLNSASSSLSSTANRHLILLNFKNGAKHILLTLTAI
jgi:hypothetical protein